MSYDPPISFSGHPTRSLSPWHWQPNEPENASQSPIYFGTLSSGPPCRPLHSVTILHLDTMHASNPFIFHPYVWVTPSPQSRRQARCFQLTTMEQL